jgi:transposase
MSKTKRNRYSAEFKAKVAREALKEESTIAEIAARFNIHPNQVSDWKKQALKGLSDVFAGKPSRDDIAHEVQVKELHAKIGQLTVERDFLAKALGAKEGQVLFLAAALVVVFLFQQFPVVLCSIVRLIDSICSCEKEVYCNATKQREVM